MVIPVIVSQVTFFTHLPSLFIVKEEDETLQPQPRFNWSQFKTEQSGFYVSFACQKWLKHPGPVSCGGSKVILGSQIGVSEHGVLLPHRAETFDGVDEFLVVHKLHGRRTELVKWRLQESGFQDTLKCLGMFESVFLHLCNTHLCVNVTWNMCAALLFDFRYKSKICFKILEDNSNNDVNRVVLNRLSIRF